MTPLLRWMARIPINEFRVLVTMALTIATCVVYLTHHLVCPEGWIEWLSFLALLAGVDVAHAFVGRPSAATIEATGRVDAAAAAAAHTIARQEARPRSSIASPVPQVHPAGVSERGD